MKTIEKTKKINSLSSRDAIFDNKTSFFSKKQILLLLLCGAIIGFLNGFFGGGGGIVCVPLLQKVLNLSSKESHATAIAVIFPLSFVSALCACGASGVPGGSLMLLPLACGLFGIDQSIAMQVVAVGFIIGVLQDSAETALNSSSDVLFTAAACLRAERLEMERVRKEELINKHLNQGD